MKHFTHFGSFGADFGIVKQANKQLKNLHEIKKGLSVRLGRIANEATSLNPDTRSNALNYLSNNGDRVATAKKFTRTRRAEQNNIENRYDNYSIKPILQKKDERFDFSPTTQQLEGVLNKNYPEYKNSVNHPKDLLITGSANHTWLTNDGKYMEMPIGQSEMPLNASMWKGRKSGVRLPDIEVNMQGEIGSPVRGISGSLLRSRADEEGLRSKLIQQSNNYNSQVANKRYIPTE